MSLAVPPPGEQVAILASIERETASLNCTIDRAQHEIGLLREYRTRLIADVVTGKLDVRGVQLPALDEDEALDDLDIEEQADADDTDQHDESDDAGQ